MRPTRNKMPPPGTPLGARTPGLLGSSNRTPLVNGRTPATRPTPLRTPKQRTNSESTKTKDPVEVFCRVRPNEDLDAETCIKVNSDTQIQLTPPSVSKAFATGKETQYSFKGIFGEGANQSEVFQRAGLPLVQDLVKGDNGLLFTYGVTGSGKTHTMQGTLEDGGIMNRVIDVLFNSVNNQQTRKYRVLPDRLNGFEIASDADAAQSRQTEMINNMKAGRSRKVNSSNPDLSGRVTEGHKLNIDEDYQYAVFISYVEVYNNYIYDLLDSPEKDIVTGKPKLLSKALREDSYRNMFVGGVTEVEVKTPEEALQTYFKGQKQRKVAQTVLNLQSSRSHSIFNIRLVAVPYDHLGEDIMNDPAVMVVSQLALVDLAGSEKTSRTGNTGERLAEASKINQSLMTLRSCIEILRENQQTGGGRMVPFRDSRLTHLFRNYFEGEGKVKMIVCVNPRVGDFDENVNVMKFAELTQEVEIERPQTVRFDLGMTPGRRRGNQIFREAMKRVESEGVQIETDDEKPLLYILSNEWPSLELTQCDQDDILPRLVSFLKKRIETRRTLCDDSGESHARFRSLLVKQEEELILLRSQYTSINSQLDKEKKKSASLEKRLAHAESANRSLNEEVASLKDTKTLLENDLDEMELLLNAEQKDKMRSKQKYRQKLISTKEKLEQEHYRRNQIERRKQQESQAKVMEKLHELNQIFAGNDENVENGAVASARAKFTVSDPDLTLAQERQARRRSRSPLKASSSDPRLSLNPVAPGSARKPSSVAVANNRHRRSRSAGVDHWLDHKPQLSVPMDTIFQPSPLKRRKSVTKIEERDLINSKVNKYLLTTQNQLDDGDIETKLYKGNVIPTSSGGRQVVLNDVEVLHQESPDGKASPKKRSFEEYRGISDRIADLQERCGQAIEGNPLTPALTRAKSKRSRI